MKKKKIDINEIMQSVYISQLPSTLKDIALGLRDSYFSHVGVASFVDYSLGRIIDALPGHSSKATKNCLHKKPLATLQCFSMKNLMDGAFPYIYDGNDLVRVDKEIAKSFWSTVWLKYLYND